MRKACWAGIGIGLAFSAVANPAMATIETLEVPGFRSAVVAVPAPSETERLLIVALHGNYDRPEWQCDVWSRVFGEGAFVLCPRGVPRRDAPPGEDRWTWDRLERTEAEVEAAEAALWKRHGPRIDKRPRVLLGFSLGAEMAARMATRRDRPIHYSRLVLVEGGDSVWTATAVRRFSTGGGSRVLAACGQAACLTRFRSRSWAFRPEKMPFLVVGTARAGHTYDGEVAAAVERNWNWLMD